jgi:hypothetical protein
VAIGLHHSDLCVGDEVVIVGRTGAGHRLVNEGVLAAVLAAGIDLSRLFVSH